MSRLAFLFLLIPVFSWSQKSKEIPYIQNENFSSGGFGIPTTVSSFIKNYSNSLTVSKKPVKNSFDETIIDTIYTFQKKKTKIQIYHSKDRDIPFYAYIDSDKVSLKGGIKVGIPKAEVTKILKTKIAGDKIQVGNLEHSQVYTFNFSKGKLILILYEGYID